LICGKRLSKVTSPARLHSGHWQRSFAFRRFFAVKVLGLHRRGDQLQAKRRGGCVKPLLTGEMRQYLRHQLALQNDLSLAELSDRIDERFGLRVSTPTLCRALQQMNLRRKKRVFLPAND
jgi:transposase